MKRCPSVVNRLVKHGGGGRGIAIEFALLPERLPQQHRADIGIGVFQLQDAPRDRPAVIQQFRRAFAHRVSSATGPVSGPSVGVTASASVSMPGLRASRVWG